MKNTGGRHWEGPFFMYGTQSQPIMSFPKLAGDTKQAIPR